MAAKLSNNQIYINDELKKLYPLAKALSPDEFKKYSNVVSQINDSEVQANQYYGNDPFISMESLYLELANRLLDKEIIRAVNKELLAYFPEANILTATEFAINKDVHKLLKLLSTFNAHENSNRFQELENLYKSISDRATQPLDPDHLAKMRSVTKVFQFKDGTVKSLVLELMHYAYHESATIDDSYEVDQGLIPKTYIGASLDRWVWYCKLVEEMISYIENTFPNWSTMASIDKKNYISSLKMSLEVPFIDKNPSLLAYIDFLENYGLNQAVTAKAKYLLKLKLPNIVTITQARKVTENSNLIK